MELKEVKDDLIFKVGRNILLFQEMELVLKFLISKSVIRGSVSDLQSNQEERKNKVSKKTLGMVVGKFLEGVEAEPIPDTVKGLFIDVSINFGTYEGEKEKIETLVAERNNLVHHFLTNVDFTSCDDLVEAAIALDEQRTRLNEVIQDLKSRVESFQDFAKILQSDDVWNHLVEKKWISN